jgi:hypothetical protein
MSVIPVLVPKGEELVIPDVVSWIVVGKKYKRRSRITSCCAFTE